MKDFSIKLKQLRKERGLSIVELSKKIGVTKKTIKHWESCDCKFRVTYLYKICKLYNVRCDWLLGISAKKYYENNLTNIDR